MRRIVIVAGGTGGHVFPAKSLAEYLSNEKNNSILIITEKRTLRYFQDFNKSNIKVLVIPALRFFGKGFLFKIWSLATIAFNVLKISLLFIKYKPKCVIGFGGYLAVAPLLTAILFRYPIFLHEQNFYLGKVNKLFSKYAKKIFISFKNDSYANNKKYIYSGLPVRSEFLELRKKSNYKNGDKYTILIVGGSQGTSVFGEVIPNSFKVLPDSLKSKLAVYHQVRKENISKVEKAWQNLNIEHTVSSFFNNMAELIFKSDLVISRSGASTIAEVNAIGRASLYIPYKFAADDHQRYNALAMVNSGASFLVNQDDFNEKYLSKFILDLFSNSNELQNKAQKSKKSFKEDTLKIFSEEINNYI